MALRNSGWRVFAACRQQVDCDTLKQMGFESPWIDYCDPDSITSGVAEVVDATGGTLDAVFNNGAHGLAGAVEDLPTEGLRDIFESNVFGWHELNRQVLPIMRRQGRGRILQCGSVLGFTTIRWRGAYTATKHAIEALSETMRLELAGSGIEVILIEPGPVKTDIRRKSIPYFEKWIDWKNSPNREMYEANLQKRLYDTSGKPDLFERPPSAAAAQVIRALNASNPTPRYFVTPLTYIARFLKRILPDRAVEYVLKNI